MECKQPKTLAWHNNQLILLDQTLLPTEVKYVAIENLEEGWKAIKNLVVRGAPAIGVAAAYILYIGIRSSEATNMDDYFTDLEKASTYLASARPTAVNLFWAIDRMNNRAKQEREREKTIDEINHALLEEAMLIHHEDIQVCKNIGEHALTLLKDGQTVLTHCNAGALATSKYGTATSAFYLAKEKGMDIRVFADETRPVNQGSRLTAWELLEAGIDVTLICDNMAAMVMKEGKIDAVIVGTDRVAANGDVANKIGTYNVALLAKEHNLPFYVAAPLSSIDMKTPTGSEIPIEERDAEEITEGFGKRTAPYEIKVYNPAFDVTPNHLVTALITEKGIVKGNYSKELPKLF